MTIDLGLPGGRTEEPAGGCGRLPLGLMEQRGVWLAQVWTGRSIHMYVPQDNKIIAGEEGGRIKKGIERSEWSGTGGGGQQQPKFISRLQARAAKLGLTRTPGDAPEGFRRPRWTNATMAAAAMAGNKVPG